MSGTMPATTSSSMSPVSMIFETAVATYRAACLRWPKAKITAFLKLLFSPISHHHSRALPERSCVGCPTTATEKIERFHVRDPALPPQFGRAPLPLGGHGAGPSRWGFDCIVDFRRAD